MIKKKKRNKFYDQNHLNLNFFQKNDSYKEVTYTHVNIESRTLTKTN